MLTRDTVRPANLKGRVSLWNVLPEGVIDLPTVWHSPNLALYGMWDFLALAASSDNKINMMYFEYKNLSAPGDPAPNPTNDKGDDVTYFLNLDSTPDVDFLRVPISAYSPRVSTDLSKYVGNAATFFAQTTGDSGYFGEPFAQASNSAVYGIALVCAVDALDVTRDIVAARVYGIKQLKINQVGAQWTLDFHDDT